MKSRILLVEDDKKVCQVIRLQLEQEGYDVEVAENGEEALKKVSPFSPDVIITDVLMPVLNGIELCRKIKETPETRFIPVIVMTNILDREKRIEALEVGADEFLNKPIDSVEMLTRLRALIRLTKLINELEDTKNIIRMLTHAIEAKDGYTEKHAERVVGYSLELAKKSGLPQHLWNTIEMGALLHDVGKIGIPESVLLKPDKLNSKEYKVIKEHPAIGVEICRPLKFLKEVLKIIHHHHERYDGKGYPDKLKGELIPLEARIISIADAYDAMTSDRPYRKGMPKEKALQFLKKGRGTQWDSQLVDHFIEIVSDNGKLS